ncbi:DUF6985 domain-containing protein [Neptunitalea lumnitzerae]|uniref:DUF6985 domain-containing protein n=1 Tax=Neptunitalea lumnitzerae TaxID=2965509 RepID=A0ABQ5MIZ9_9FLAO|nr:hypothetical protein [Neptunitalea sp. Y10]GLB49384.1 hypothetical protein Y10_17520 [Neptunitalea sp. Y10]
MQYEIIRDEDDLLMVFLPYKQLFNETYNPEGYTEFPDVNFVFNNTDEKEEPSVEQIRTLEFIINNSIVLSDLISSFIQKEREQLLALNIIPEEAINNPKEHYRFSTIYIDDEYKDDFAYYGLTGSCSWDEEHGFGVAFYKKVMIDFGDWDTGYTMYTSNRDKPFSLTDEYSGRLDDIQKTEMVNTSKNIDASQEYSKNEPLNKEPIEPIQTKTKRKNNFRLIGIIAFLVVSLLLLKYYRSSQKDASTGEGFFNDTVELTYYNEYKGVATKKYEKDNRTYVDVRFKSGTMRVSFPYEKQDILSFIKVGDSVIKENKTLVLEVKRKELDTLFYFKFDKLPNYKDHSKSNKYILEQQSRNSKTQ